MTQEDVKKKMREGVRRVAPIAVEINSLIADAYQEGFKMGIKSYTLRFSQRRDKRIA